jgi:Inner membrane component of T3SS, cytoplasmic domain
VSGNDGKGRRAAERRRQRDGKPAPDPGADLTRPGALPPRSDEAAPSAHDTELPMVSDVERLDSNSDEAPAQDGTRPGRRARAASMSGPENDPEASFVRAVRRTKEESDGGPAEMTAVRAGKRRTRRAGGKLVVLVEGEAQGEIPLSITPSLVGRANDAEIKLEDPCVSRRHVEIRSGDDGFVLYDLGSTSGTLVNGAIADGEVTLAHGDVIALGKTELRFLRADKAPAERPAPPPKEPTLIEATLQLPKDKTQTKHALTQKTVAVVSLEKKQRVRKLAVGVISACIALLVVAVMARVVQTQVFGDTSPAQVRAQLAQLLAEGNKKLLAQDVDGAFATAETMLALDPTNTDAESLRKMARTEQEARDALELALRLGDEERDQEAEQILKRIPDASTFAKDRDRLRRTLAERGMIRSRRSIEMLLDRGDWKEALAAAEAHVQKWPNDTEGKELLDRAQKAAASQPKNPALSRARQQFADGDIDGARATALEAGYRAYAADLDKFVLALKRGKDALKQSLDGATALPHLDEAYRLLPGLGGGPQSAIVQETRKPYANALYLTGTEKLARGDRCGAARDLFKAGRVVPEDPKIQTKLRALADQAEQGLVRARAARTQDPERAAAIAREALCVAQTGSRTHEDLKQLARL